MRPSREDNLDTEELGPNWYVPKRRELLKSKVMKWPRHWPRKMKKIAELLGVEIVPVDDCLTDLVGSSPGNTWFDGERIYTQYKHSAWYVMHELGHYIAAHPEDRKLANYGIDADGSPSRPRVTTEQENENTACYIHFALMRKLRRKPSFIIRNAKECSFLDSRSQSPVETPQGQKRELKRLIALGYAVMRERAPGVMELL